MEKEEIAQNIDEIQKGMCWKYRLCRDCKKLIHSSAGYIYVENDEENFLCLCVDCQKIEEEKWYKIALIRDDERKEKMRKYIQNNI